MFGRMQQCVAREIITRYVEQEATNNKQQTTNMHAVRMKIDLISMASLICSTIGLEDGGINATALYSTK